MTPQRAGWLCAWVVACAAHAAPGAEGEFVALLPGSQQWVGARLLGQGLANGRYATLQLRTAVAVPQASAPAAWQVQADTTWVVDCAGSRPMVASVAAAAAGGPWASASVRPQDMAFQPLPDGAVAAQAGRLLLPDALRAGAVYACGAAARPALAGAWATWVQRTAALPDVVHWRCHMVARADQATTVLHLGASDGAGAVLLNETWQHQGTLTAQYLAVTAGGLDVRMLRGSGAIRVVDRDQMAPVGTGQCQREVLASPLHATGQGVATGW